MVYRNELGQVHRVDGPAIILTNGDKFWYVNDLRHRTDGPAVQWADGYCEWWVDGRRMTDFEVWVITGAKASV